MDFGIGNIFLVSFQVITATSECNNNGGGDNTVILNAIVCSNKCVFVLVHCFFRRRFLDCCSMVGLIGGDAIAVELSGCGFVSLRDAYLCRCCVVVVRLFLFQSHYCVSTTIF